ncbi:hypothetical protein CSAL01_07387 [Colletotrichum salicis]|uniref:Uncharacterized protein n=1 Tax=Colletotrichum salicis TaxID=1209931 RepID=A0A135U5C2_9PEZI|nr:hypothetical protein CSAL01_07387 [Colletotrichum salicis]
MPERIGFSAGQGFQLARDLEFLPGYSDAPGLPAHLLLPLPGVLLLRLLNSIMHLTVTEEDADDANGFAQLKFRKFHLVNTHPIFPRICILQFRGMLATHEMLPFATDEMHGGPLSTQHIFQKPHIQTRQVPCDCNYDCGSQATAWTA